MTTTTTTGKRRWIIGKDGRRCGDFHCTGYDRHNAKIERIDADGTVQTRCRHCNKPHTYKSREYKERRACRGCGHKRDVTVHIWQDGKEHARDYCEACELEQSATRHVDTALHLRNKAKKIRAARRVQSTATTEPTS